MYEVILTTNGSAKSYIVSKEKYFELQTELENDSNKKSQTVELIDSFEMGFKSF